jgi:hypothetical protein
VTSPEQNPRPRLEFTLRKPWLGWFPRPTVEFEGRGQPAQWGTGTWQLPAERPTTIKVFLFNRLWKFGAAEVVVGGEPPAALVYSAPWLPFLPGTIRVVDPGPES